MDNNQETQINDEEESIFSFLDFHKLLSDVVRFWWLFVVAVAIAFIGLKYYHSYTTPIYSANTSIIIDNAGSGSSSTALTDGVLLSAGYRNFDNQLAILNSRTLTEKVVDDMGIFIDYFHVGHIKDVECFPSANLYVVMDSLHVQPIGTDIFLSPIDNERVAIHVDAEVIELYNYSMKESMGKMEQIHFDATVRYGESVVTPWCAFSVNCQTPLADKFYFRFNSPRALTQKYKAGLGISHDKSSESSVVTLSINGTSPRKNELFLNTLVNRYIQDNLDQKNLVSESTIRFIEQQLSLITDSLDHFGSQLSKFRSENRLENSVSTKGHSLSSELREFEKQINDQEIALRYYDYLDSYFSNDSVLYGTIAPAMFDTKSPIITKQIGAIMDLYNKRQTYKDTYAHDGNIQVAALNAELNIARNTLLISIASHKNMVNDNIKELNNKISSYNVELGNLPETERQMLGIDRKFSLNSEVYNYLMKKRSEAQIQKASNTPDHKILDAAITSGIISPNVKKNQTMCLALAIILPLLFLVLRQVVDTHIRSAGDIKKISELSVIGEVPNNNKETVHVVQEYPRSFLAEEFRRIRIKIDFLTKGKKTPVIAVTSAMPGDGKTFCALNTAEVFAITKKKTLLMGFDLRKPGLTKMLQTQNQMGITDYLIGNCNLEDIILKFNDLYVVGSGTVPPNPSELIQSEQCSLMMEKLIQDFDVIVIDTPPVSLVSDFFQLTKWTDTNIFIVRQDYTDKETLKYALESLRENGVTNAAIMVNDINNKNTRYGYGYGYGSYGRYGRYGKYGKYGKYGYGHYGHYGYGTYGEDSHGYTEG